jgi:hypothetical protein
MRLTERHGDVRDVVKVGSTTSSRSIVFDLGVISGARNAAQ